MRLSCPNGYFVDNHVIFGDPGTGSIVSKFYDVTFPDLSASDEQAHIDLETDLSLMLGALGEDERAQLQFYTGNDYEKELGRYVSITDKTVGICFGVRTELGKRFRNRISDETLIRTRAILCLSSRLPRFVKEDGKKVKGFEDVFRITARSFESREQFFNLLLSGYGGSVNGLDNIGNYKELLRYWSPSQVRKADINGLDFFRSIQDLCCFSGLAPRHENSYGFYMDGYYFGVLVAKKMPGSTSFRTMDSFLELSIPNLRVVLNIQPLAIGQEIMHEEVRYDKMLDNLGTKPGEKASLAAITAVKRHEIRHELLTSGRVKPFKAQLIVIACERTPDKLDERMEALRAALGKTGCEQHNPALPTSTLSFFNSATPGYGSWNKYPDYWHKMDDAVNVANLMPSQSTPEADLATADWICDGEINNLIGGTHFKGGQPQPTLVAGTTGSGKSVTLQTILLQSAPIFKFIVIIDDGLSWMTTAKKLDPNCRTIVIKSNGTQTFNPLDTKGNELTNQHKASATALVHLLVGQHSDEDTDKLRHAIIAETISEVYAAAFRKWRKNHPIAHYDLIRKHENDLGFSTLLKQEYESFVQNEAYSQWTPEMFPTLANLQDELLAASLQKGPHQEHCAALSTLLRPWLRDGIYGPIVDGSGNVDIGGVEYGENDPLKVVHFELGELGKSESELRAVAGFLIANEVRNHIQGMPRGIKKCAIIEEMVSFLKVPDAETIVVDYWQQMRKYSTQMWAVFQNYSTLLEASPKVAKALISNSSQLLLLRNHNREDLNTLSKYVKLPEVIKDKIMRFPKPAELKGKDQYAGFVFCQLDGESPKFTIGRNYISRQVEEITSSTGADFDKKKGTL